MSPHNRNNYTFQRKNGRMSVPSSQEELAKQRRAAFQDAPDSITPAKKQPAPTTAASISSKASEEMDIMAPFRKEGARGTGQFNRVQGAGTPSRQGTGSFNRVQSVGTPSHQGTGSFDRISQRTADASRSGRLPRIVIDATSPTPDTSNYSRQTYSEGDNTRMAYEAEARNRYKTDADRYSNQHMRTNASVQPDYTSASVSGSFTRVQDNKNSFAQGPSLQPMSINDPYSNRRPAGGFSFARIALAAIVVVVVGVGGFFGWQAWSLTQPISVVLNGEEKTIDGDARSIQGLIDKGVVQVVPGDLIAVDNSVLEAGQGKVCTAVVNDAETEDYEAHLYEGDVIQLTDGADIMEEHTDTNPQVIPYEFEKRGSGALHVFLSHGEEGEKVTRTGAVSGKTVEAITKEPVNRTLQYYNADTKGDKVIALTFDDGPWDGTTQDILNTLAEYDVKATFYTLGKQIPGNSEVIKQMHEAGHEIATHTYDHAAGSGEGVSLDKMSTQERRDEITKGLAEIEKVTGTEASKAFRAPGGNFNEKTAQDVADLITAEVGWNVDTLDWQLPGADVIAERIMSAENGEIVLMHDGGGDRTQTAAALKQALPYLIEQGYTFVTVSELIERYPYEA